MNKIFLDTNVILDFLLDREPFVDDIEAVINHALLSNVSVCVSPVTVTTVNYVVGRIEGKLQARNKIGKILELITVEELGPVEIERAQDSTFKDFEDAVQNFCADRAGHRIIITRNTKDFRESELAIFTPKEYLVKIRQS